MAGSDTKGPGVWHRAVVAAERRLDEAPYWLYRQLGRDRPRFLVGYDGLSTSPWPCSSVNR